MRAEIKRVREDRVTFSFDGDAPVIEAGYPPRTYSAKVKRIEARFAEDGTLLSVAPFGKKIKKDGGDSQVSAYFGWKFTKLDDDVIQWARKAGIDAKGRSES